MSSSKRTPHSQSFNSLSGNGSKNSGPTDPFPLSLPNLTLRLGGYRNDLDDRVLASGQHDFLARFGAGDELGQVGLGSVDGIGRHAEI